MLLNSQNRNSVSQVLSANLGGLVLEAVVTHRSTPAATCRTVSKRPTRFFLIGGRSMQPSMGHLPADGYRHSAAPAVDSRRQARRERDLQVTQQPAGGGYQAALWAAIVMSKIARG